MDPSPTPGRQPEPIRLSPVARSERGAGPVVVALLLLLAVAIVKPWGGGSRPPSGASPGPLAGSVASTSTGPGAPASGGSSSAVVVPPALPDPVDAIRCLAPQGWRLVTYESSADRVVRSWIVVAPVTALGPLDPPIVPLTLVSDSLVGLGLCAPGEGPGAAPWSLIAPRLAGMWRLSGTTGAGPTTAEALVVQPFDPLAPVTVPDPSGSPTTGPSRSPGEPPTTSAPPDLYDGPLASTVAGRLAFLYAAPHPVGPPSTRLSASPSSEGPVIWTAGRYVMALVEPGSGAVLWFGLILTSPAAHGASANSPRP